MSDRRAGLTITIMGLPKSGKSTAAYVIADLLQELGAAVRIEEEYGDPPPRTLASKERTKQALEGREIVIKTVGARRSGR